MVESRHRAAVAVVDAAGRVANAWGDVERPIYGRSALKPLQALPIIETGAAERYGLGVAEIALASASHGGEPRHVELASAWLARIGCAESDLECGPQWPAHEPSALALARSGASPGPIHNNCSGKHSGMLATARHLGEATRDYILFEHPVQQRVRDVLAAMTSLDLGSAPRGLDGCGIPVIGIPLRAIALAMARLADPGALSPERAAAARAIVAAMMAEPFLVAGTGEFNTLFMRALEGAAAIKAGAEGVYTAALPGLGLGVAIKIDDGAGRAASVALARVLHRLGAVSPAQAVGLSDLFAGPVLNRAGVEVGRVRPAADCPF
jgi:L-asparaginase II